VRTGGCRMRGFIRRLTRGILGSMDAPPMWRWTGHVGPTWFVPVKQEAPNLAAGGRRRSLVSVGEISCAWFSCKT
jgi:hypothetical protein